MEERKINWFPGHMKKATSDLKKIKHLDLIIEVVDARAIKSSSNPELTQLFKQLPKVRVALKKDLADLSTIDQSQVDLIGSIHEHELRKKIIQKMDEILANKINTLKKKGLVAPQLYVLVVGISNVGKSSLIKCLKQHGKIIVENRPGVTKHQQLIKINERYFLYDTPGIMMKKISSITEGYILGLINTINPAVLPMEDVLNFAWNYLTQHYLPQLIKYYHPSIQTMDLNAFIHYLQTKHHLPTSKRAYDFWFNELINGKIGKVNYEQN
ncbi:MAG: ribosome biogenesis GTPase YlqF [Mycoplasmataceae bacterium]|nr:ribosome biogenesis GTPase YlqF [Mycoplasmataceae bacterium]